MNHPTDPGFQFEDISSSSSKNHPVITAVRDYGNGAFRHLDKIIKAIAYFVALALLLVFAGGAFLLYKMSKTFFLPAICLLAAGVLLSLMVLFLIYAIGHIISQNNEILKHL
ncbi:MAG: hypothetical protein IJT66_06135 [Clostridia bacterium]|nr:hypothetical protein [Clostridia bacterium]